MFLKKIIQIYLQNFTSLLIIFIISSSNSFAAMNSETWDFICNENNKKDCEVLIYNVNKTENGKLQRLAKAYVKIGKTQKKKMDLVSEEDQTYKLGLEEKATPVLFVQIPLNVDLRQKPLIKIGEKNIGFLNYLHCNPTIGCLTMVALNTDEAIKLFKEGREMIVYFKVFGSSNNFDFKFPLKGFTKSYKKLSEIN